MVPPSDQADGSPDQVQAHEPVLREPATVRNAPLREAEPLYSSVAGDRAALPSSRAASPPPPTTPLSNGPLINGPSFLGLNQPGPAPASSRRSSLSIDPSSRSDLRSFDYLLNEEDERTGGAWKYVAVFVLLLVAAGFAYLRWKSQTQGWFKTNKPAAVEQAADSSNTGPAPVPSSASSAAPAQDATKNQTVAQPSNSQTGSAPQPPAAAGNGTTPASVNGSAPASPTTAGGDSSSTNTPTAEAARKAESGDSDSEEASTAKADTSVAPAPKKHEAARAKPTPTVPKVDMSNEIAVATQYIYGKGVPQDCDRGLRLLKPAANQSDPRAMIQMGALYSAGLCTPRDLPTSYRWFALALRKEPDNMSVQGDLQKLWGEMTPPERQLAIRLTH